MHIPPSRHTQGELAAYLLRRQMSVLGRLLGEEPSSPPGCCLCSPTWGCLTVSLPLMQWPNRLYVVLQEERRTAGPQHPQENSLCPCQGQLSPSKVTTCHLVVAACNALCRHDYVVSCKGSLAAAAGTTTVEFTKLHLCCQSLQGLLLT